MILKQELYIQDGRYTLAENIDRAWEIYTDKSESENNIKDAQDFLIYAFNLKITDDINQQITSLMHKRQAAKKYNPQFIPGHAPIELGLKPKDMMPSATRVHRYSSNSKTINRLFQSHELLDVNEASKLADKDYGSQITYLEAKERSKYRVIIYNNKFYQAGEIFSTSHYIAHGKQGFAAFTINLNGEISIFNHRYGKDGLVHSSMNAGCPVMYAGEIEIIDGELRTINTYSGHYEPSLFSVYRALDFFSNRGIDISTATIELFQSPSDHSLGTSTAPSSIQRTHEDSFYQISATECFLDIQVAIDEATVSIEHDLNNYQSAEPVKNTIFFLKDRIIGSNLTRERHSIATRVLATVSRFKENFPDMDIMPDKQDIEQLTRDLQAHKSANEQLSLAHKKHINNGRLQQHLEKLLREVTTAYIKPRSEQDITAMKKLF